MKTLRIGMVALLCILALATDATEAHAQNKYVAGAVGGAAGLLAGGYVTVGIITARANFQGHYLHDLGGILGWQSTPVLVGSGVGALIGYLQPERLERTIGYGAGGAVAGAGIGMIIGTLTTDAPVGKWAGGVMGGAAGILLGSLAGAVLPMKDKGDNAGSSGVVIPLTVRVGL